MQALSLVLCAAAFASQAGAPAVKPDWSAELESLPREAADAPLGSLDAKAEQAWAAALQNPIWPELQTAAVMLSSYYDSQGYELKAEHVLRQALAAAPRDDVEGRRGMMSQLASHFVNTQQLAKAASLMEDLAKEAPAAHEQRTSLASIYERMGEMEKAEALWMQASSEPMRSASSGAHRITGLYAPGRTPVDGATTARNELAGFYARHGRAADAERVYKRVLADSAQGGVSTRITATEGYLAFLFEQRRFNEAIDLERGLIAKLETSSDAEAPRALFYARERLAGLFAQTGRVDEAMALRRRAAEQAGDPSEAAPALAALAEALIAQKRLDEAEATIGKLRALGRSDARGASFHESMGTQMLARVRDLQNRPDEARRLRESAGVPDVTNFKRMNTVFDLTGPAQQKAMQGDLDGAVTDAGRALAAARDRVRTNAQEAAGLAPLAMMLMEKRPADAKRIALEAARMLDDAPDHPRVADALGSLVSPLCGLGLVGEAARAIDRQKSILAQAKGVESPAMNAVGNGRIALLQHDSDWTGVLEERRRMLARVENASGPRSVDSLYALRELAWAYSYSPVNDWPEEREVLGRLMERTARLRVGATDVANLYEHMANRASHHGQFDVALEWAERGIEAARGVPDGQVYVQNMIQLRDRIRSGMRSR